MVLKEGLRKVKKLLGRRMKPAAAVVCMVLLVGSTACRAGVMEDPNMGLYQAVSAEQIIDKEGNTQPVDETRVQSLSLELGTYGRAVFHVNGKDAKLNWKVDPEAEEGTPNLLLTSDRENAAGTIKDGMITVSFNDLIIRLERTDSGESVSESQ